MFDNNHPQLIRNLLNLSNEAIAIVNPDTSSIIFVNEKMCTNLGYSLDELKRMRVFDFDTVVSDSSKWEKAILEVKEHGSMIVQSEHRRKDGTVFPVEISIKFLVFDNQSYIVAIVRDMTEIKLYEEKILVSENKFSNLSENLSGLVYQADPETFAAIYVNKAHDSLYGYSVEEWLRNPGLWVDTIYPDDKERVITALKEAGRKLINGVIEYRIKSKDNKIHWVEDHYSWEMDKQGNPKSINGVVYDITERKQAEKELEKSENRFKRIFNTTSVSIREEDYSEVVKAIDDLKAGGVKDFRRYLDENPDLVYMAAQMINILDVNDAALKLYGARNKSEMLGPINKFFTSESYKVFKEKLVAIAEGKGYFEAEIINKRLDSKPIEVLISGAIPSQHMEFTNLLVSMFDITDRKKMEQELLKMHKLESLGILAGGIAHDFNNVMTGILGNITLAKMWAGSESKVIEILDRAEKACLRTKELTQQLITFSKGGTPVKRNISIAELIKDSVTFTLSGSNTKPVFNIHENLWPTEVDAGQISQVINNLILNADQAMPDGGIIEVGCENIVTEEENAIPLNKGKYVKITVSDQGFGIAKEHLDKIFDPYFTTKQRGSGLGLSSVYSIIKKHAGYITVESELGKGATFYIYLPASMSNVIEKREDEENPFFGTGRILLMDDEEIIRDVGSQMLESLGYDVKVAEDGLKAIELYKIAKDSGRHFDVVILDLTIQGGMGGKEAIRNLHLIDPDVKAIVSSGYSIDTVMSEYQEYGFKDFLIKPYKLVEIGKVVNRVMKELK